MFDETSLDRLRFLEGRWSGVAPDGTPFYEEYDRPGPATWRSRRYDDATFSDVTDGSTVKLSDGKIISTWGEYEWSATEISEDQASFEPINAPSSFSWRRVDQETLEVTQQWQDENGTPQRYVLSLKRVR